MSKQSEKKEYSMDKQALGREGERLAKEFLERQGYRILARNYRYSGGEVDIIAKKDDELCFVEVRSRWLAQHGHPLETITRPKQKRVIRVAEYYLAQEGIAEQPVSFGAIGIVFSPDEEPDISFVPDAFMA